MSSEREFDLIIFGATGFTGLMMVRELALSLSGNPKEYSGLKWAVAGRNLAKLDSVLEKVGNELGQDLSATVKVQADVSQPESLRAMAGRTRLVVNSVGPYGQFGRPVVEACVDAGTCHIDLSGEHAFIEATQLDFDGRARETGALIISACGWDCIPTDLGVAFLKKHFPGQLHSVETFVNILPGDEGYILNTGTFNSMSTIVPDTIAYRGIHSRLYSELLNKKLPQSRIPLSTRLLPFSRHDFPGVNVLFPAADKPTVERSQYYAWEQYQETPVQVQTYINADSWSSVAKFSLIGTLIGPFLLFEAGRSLLRKFPHIFTFGYFSSQGPSRAQIDTTRFTTRLVGKGWSAESSLPNGQEPTKPFDAKMTVLVSGRDPAYLATSTAIIQSALTICTERDKMPKGGVLTTASAFRDTKLIERLNQHGMEFKIISQKP